MRDWLQIVTSAGMILLIFLHFCGNDPTNTVTTIQKTTKIYYDSAKHDMKAPPATVVSTQTVPVPTYIMADTATIRILLNKFFAVNTVTRGAQDSSIRWEMTDTISQNAIKGSLFSYKWLKPVKTVESSTITLLKEHNGFYFGAFAIGNKNAVGFGPEASFITKKGLEFDAGYDLLNQQFKIGSKFKIK